METVLLIIIPLFVYVVVNRAFHKVANLSLRFNLRLAVVVVCLSFLYVSHFIYGNGKLPGIIGVTVYLSGSFFWRFFKEKRKLRVLEDR